jgi:hypothetical protein
MARGIATRALAGGNSVTVLGTGADKAEALAGELGGDVAPARSGTRSPGRSSSSPSGTPPSMTSSTGTGTSSTARS